jgi:hypothetical protein
VSLPPIPRWKIVTGVVAVSVLIAAAVIVLWWAGTRGLEGKDLVTARLDALRVGLSLGVGGGGVFALYLAWRRQRSTEADLDNRERTLAHQLQVAAATESDAEARRITDLYTKAVEQLGSDKAPVRLGGMYALERLAQDNPGQRQTIVNVWCAYLRMPFTLPGDPPADDADDQTRMVYRRRVQEREVRRTVQHLLETHLRPDDDPVKPSEIFWTDIDLDLTGATLIEFDFAGRKVRSASFTRTRFVDDAIFDDAQFAGNASFHQATFDHNAWFREIRFGGGAVFTEARFTAHVWFTETKFNAFAGFSRCEFAGQTWFDRVAFEDLTFFGGVQFKGPTKFDQATFSGPTPSEVKPYLSRP